MIRTCVPNHAFTVAIMFLAGATVAAHAQDAIDATVSNTKADQIVTRLEATDNTLNVQGLGDLARERLTNVLHKVDLPKGYTVQAAFTFGEGVVFRIVPPPMKEGESYLDYAKRLGGVVPQNASLTVDVPKLEATFQVVKTNEKPKTFTFAGGLFAGSYERKGLCELVDMSLGHLVKNLLREGILPAGQLRVLVDSQWIPKSPFLYVKLGAPVQTDTRIYQDGNLLEALSELGAPAVPYLDAASKDENADVQEEATRLLKKIQEKK